MASTGEVWRLGRRPALDGLRGVAVLLVVLQHAEVPHMDGGGVVGVTMFFVLSGFLITALLLEERERSGRVPLLAFYLRRSLRLMPALWVCVTLVTVLSASLGAPGETYLPPWQWLAAVTYTSDLTAMQNPAGALNHTWTLAVEEKFYLLWPLALVLLRTRRSLALAACLGIGVSTWLRFEGWDAGAGLTAVQYGPHTHASSLLVGCLLAISLHGRRAIRTDPWAGITLLAVAAAASVASADYLRHLWLPTAVPLAVAVGLWLLVRGPESWTPLSWRPLVVVGQRSYALYLWNWPVSLLVHLMFGWDQNWLVHLALVLPVTSGLTLMSWRYVESPFLRLKDRAARSADPEPVERGHVRARDAAVSA